MLLLLLMPVGLVQAATPAPPSINTNEIFDVTNAVFAGGALGNGVSNSAAAIQAAISMASTSIIASATGGTVRVRAVGTFTNYLCGPISLKNNVNLLIDSGTKLQMLPFGSYPTNPSPTDFISASNLHDIEISGSGTIDGQGAPWWAAYEANGIARPKAMFAPSNCKRVLVQDVTLQSPPNTHISLRSKCGDVNIQRITINTTSDVVSDNTDGIDVNATNCLIQASYIYCGDDHIAIGGGSGDITITNCTLGAGHGVSIGSSTDGGGVHDLIVSNCTMTIPPDGSLSSGIRGKSARDRGGLVQKLNYASMTLTNVQNPIFISSYYPDSTIPSNPATDPGSNITSTTPIWRNITISNVTTFASSGHNVGRIYGLPEMLISNVALSEVTATGDLSFDMYNIQAIQFIDSQITVPATTNTLNLYNVQLTITNSVLNTNLVKIGGWTSSHATNQVSLFNANVAITDTNILRIPTPITLGGSTLSFNQTSASFSNSLNIVSGSTVQFTRGTNTFFGALVGSGPLTLALTNSNIMVVLQGSASGFAGTLALSSNGTLRLDQGVNTWGDSNGLFDAGTAGTINNHSSGNISIPLGGLTGGSGSTLRGSDQTGPGLDTYVIGGRNSNTTFAGTITNGTSTTSPHLVALTKIGNGTFTLTGTNSYGGGTTVSNGVLFVNNTGGGATGTGAVTIVSGATLGGSGVIAGPVTVNGTLSPGNSPGTLTVSNNLVINNSGILQYNLGTNSDLTAVSGNLTVNGILNVTDSGGFTNTTYTLFTYGGSLANNGLTVGATPNAGFDYSIDTNLAGQVRLIVSASGGVGAAGPITGPTSVNTGDSSQGYSISSVSGATNYTWTVPSGASIASGQGTTSITVNFGCGASSGNVTVTPSNGSGSGGSSSLPVTVAAVGAAGAISGLSAVCVGQVGDTYSISSVSGGTTYAWAVPPGTSIAGGQGTTSITVTWGSTSGNVTVVPGNANGCTGAASSLPVTANTAPNIGSGPLPQTVCALDTAQFSLSATGGNLTYQWRKNGSPLSDGGTVTGSTTSNLVLTGLDTGDSGASFDCVVSGSCAPPATSTTVSLTVNPLPTVFNVTGGGTFCITVGGQPVGLDGSQSGVNYQLQVDGNPTNAPVSGTGNPLSFGNQTMSGNYTVVAVDATTGCTVAMNGSAPLAFVTDPFQCWQLQYFGCTGCPQADGDADPDGDGMSNTNEFLSGTDPTNSASVLRIISTVRQTTDVMIVWTTAGGHTNAVQASSGDANGNYTTNFVDITTPPHVIIPGSGDATNNYLDGGGATNGPSRFYRIRLVP